MADQADIKRQLHSGNGRSRHALAFQFLRFELKPLRRGVLLQPELNIIENLHRAGFGPHGNNIFYLNMKGRDCHLPAVHVNMAVGNELAGDPRRLGNAQKEDHMVQPALQAVHYLLFVIFAEHPHHLLVIEAVKDLDLLLFLKLFPEIGDSVARLAVLARTVRMAHHSALRRIATIPLEEKLDSQRSFFFLGDSLHFIYQAVKMRLQIVIESVILNISNDLLFIFIVLIFIILFDLDSI